MFCIIAQKGLKGAPSQGFLVLVVLKNSSGDFDALAIAEKSQANCRDLANVLSVILV
jgi:hypothetical protein